MRNITDHPARTALANELHARPFPKMERTGQVAFLALMPLPGAMRDLGAERAHLLALLDQHAAAHPQPDATHYFGQIGDLWLKWESHSEFVTFTLFAQTGQRSRAFDAALLDVFGEKWLADAPYVRVTSALIEVDMDQSTGLSASVLDDWFDLESLALSNVLDQAATIAGDFRVDEAGHMRFAVFAGAGTGPRRVGRIIQRICEIETYKAMAMLGFFRAGEAGAELARLDGQLSEIVAGLNSPGPDPEQVLQRLLAVSAALERLESTTSYRFGATGAYERIVQQRISVLREDRVEGRQTFAEFMMRRFDPAMRTVKSVQARLAAATRRAGRAGELLRTQVEVSRSAQNQALLQSMDRRADLQLRLQTTVEGLSVVAISYYAISILGYLIYPLADTLVVSRGWVMAAITLPVVALVWLAVRRIRRRAHG